MVVARTEVSVGKAKSSSLSPAINNLHNSLVSGYDDPTAALIALYGKFAHYEQQGRTLLAEIDKHAGKTTTDPVADSILIERFARMHVLLPTELLNLRIPLGRLSSLPAEEQARFKALQDAAKLQEKREQTAKNTSRRNSLPAPTRRNISEGVA